LKQGCDGKTMPLTEVPPFGTLLKHLRKRAGITQSDLATAVNYSCAQISSLEKGKGQPNLEVVITRFIQALRLQDDPVTAAQLIERAAEARGERPPAAVILQRATRLVNQEELDEQPGALPL
jgi:transcriptional regulator with XRE-family HTH domain